MKIYSYSKSRSKRRTTVLALLLNIATLGVVLPTGQLQRSVFHLQSAQAQIHIGGNVYGGGNAGDLTGSTSVTVRAGNLEGSVFGGARQANVGGNTFVHVDGEHISGDITINYVYGGNDISGTVGNNSEATRTVPAELQKATANGIDDSYDAFTLVTPERTVTSTTGEGGQAVTTTSQPFSIFIGQMFGGGNGAYDYRAGTAETNPYFGMTLPEVNKTYQEIRGGTYGYVFAGGNNATVKGAADICIDNAVEPMTANGHLTLPETVNLSNLSAELDKPYNQRLMDMGLNITTFKRGYNFQRVFGGNNMADMHIQPTWHLEDGKIGSLYSGGNEGDMTSPIGLLLEIGKKDPATGLVRPSEIEVVNVFGGCRKANVEPLDAPREEGGEAVTEILSPEGYKFPNDLAARVLVRSGHITNVYGGNDITGHVRGGTAIGVYTTIGGSVYGGGNGSYAYTDNDKFKGDVLWGDFYYDVNSILGNAEGTAFTGLQSAEALNRHRPNAEQVSIRIWGPDEATPTVVKGAVYLGGNSASLATSSKAKPKVELKIGSHVIAESVFLGNNGENMVDAQEGGVLWQYAQKQLHYQTGSTESEEEVAFSTMDLTDKEVFAKYMEGCAMKLIPSVVFDNEANGDPDTYLGHTAYIGSFFCGGNVGSMMIDGVEQINFNHKVTIYDKLVGGCNKANVEAHDGMNAFYEGGLLGSRDAATGNKLVLDLEGLQIEPKRWADDSKTALVWNVIDGEGEPTTVPTALPAGGTPTDADKARRLKNGHVYGGCYESGHVDGNVVININETLMDRNKLFDKLEYESGEPKLYEGGYKITQRNTGVILNEQGMDVLGSALNIFGGGYGRYSEIWGSTTINLNKGYVFQIFGGGEKGAVGKRKETAAGMPDKDDNGDYSYDYNAAYSTTINLKGDSRWPGVARFADGDDPGMAEAEFIYGGGFEGIIAGDTHVYLGNGRIFNSFAGSCNADILGHTETYVGLNTSNANDTGFPWIRDHIYGGNDLGGEIKGSASFASHVSTEAAGMVYHPAGAGVAEPTTASAYTEYLQGHVGNIFGGCYGDYDYTSAPYKEHVKKKPALDNAFVNIRPITNEGNAFTHVFGAGQGYSGYREGDNSQNRSYVLIDIRQSVDKFKTAEVFGAGAYDGLGMDFKPEDVTTANADKATAIIDLVHGELSAAYGGSFNEGITRRTMVNVPAGATVKIGKIFGGAYGNSTVRPCDVYESNVNYASHDAETSAIYGGNNSERRTVYTKVNIGSKVYSNKQRGYTASVYGAGFGPNTWAEYTEVALNSGAEVYEVYGGGQNGKVFNAESVQAYMQAYKTTPPATITTDQYSGDWKTEAWPEAWTFGKYYTPDEGFTNYNTDSKFNLSNASLVRTAEMDDRDRKSYRYNTNVIINEGATVAGYAYGGGRGAGATIAGTTYIALLGGTVVKDLYAAGTSGAVIDMMGIGHYDQTANPNGFTASSNAYILGGTARNVYGGGWEGHVGYHIGNVEQSNDHDIDGETHVVIGRPGGTSLTDGQPAIARNVYGGGEGGSIYGKAHVTMNNGYIGYRYTVPGGSTTGTYAEVLDDATEGDNLLDKAGNIFGGGYVANSFTDESAIKMYGGTVRGSLYGGGEIGPIGRGTALPEKQASRPEWAFVNNEATIYKGGKASVELYGGHVMRNVFGGGRGFDNWGGDGTKFMSEEVLATLDKSVKGFVFGSTDVHIRGGEVGTVYNVTHGGYGNVFGGGDVGYVYSATGTKKGVRKTQALSEMTNGLPNDGGGYYYSKWVEEDRIQCELSLDCNVVVEPYCQVKPGQEITINNTYTEGQYVPTEELNSLLNKTADKAQWDKINYESGVTIHNAVFAGGNVTIGSDLTYVNTGTVYGNVSAALRDVYNRDLITIGTEHTGGLYGDGNLTMVDGWRELHIDNFGTDYYSQNQEISKEEYDNMSDRERAYFVLNYRCKSEVTDNNGTVHGKGSRMTSDEFKDAFAYEVYPNIEDNPSYQAGFILADGTPNPEYFEELGFCSLYAGRLLNTIQRCDMAAIWGSRIVLQGARDRVPEKADYARYTLNRVGELSLNQRKAQNTSEPKDNKKHGNYFGIYSMVNYLGNLTSDVFFITNEQATAAGVSNDEYSYIRTTNSSREENAANGTTTYYEWKKSHAGQPNRNNATCPNKVSLASGVYLELIREESEKKPDSEKEWGLITGVVELDLIDVKTGLGGGYVYARNQHGTKTWHPEWSKVNLSPYNATARTYKRFVYDETESNLKEIETSGNFVHNTKQIVDDCYPNANAYHGADKSPAHYWYIKGSVYVYDQYISAYTGAASAYAQTVSIPLTISAASHGKLTLRDVQPNLYAYYGDDYADGQRQPLGTGSVIVNGITYHAGDPIDYWSYQSLTAADQQHFVPKVYNTIAECEITVNGKTTTYPEGTVLLPNDYTALKNRVPAIANPDNENDPAGQYIYDKERKEWVTFDHVFREANVIGHNQGFILTYDMNNPGLWDDYYTLKTDKNEKISAEAYNEKDKSGSYKVDHSLYYESPTYSPKVSGVYGQKVYKPGDIIPSSVYHNYTANVASYVGEGQATVAQAYVMTDSWSGKNVNGEDQQLAKGTPVYEANYAPEVWAAMPKAEAKLCTSTLQISETEYIYVGQLISTAEYDGLASRLTGVALTNYFDGAYYVTQGGKYGGSYYTTNQAYRALDAWCDLSATDRQNFIFNYDALDLLIDPTYAGGYGFKPQYDGYKPGTTQRQIDIHSATAQYDGHTPLSPNIYSTTQPIDYEAEFSPTDVHQSELGNYYHNDSQTLTYTDENNQTVTINTGYDARIKRPAFEDIPNERVHWSPILISAPGTYYVVKQPFIRGDLPYTVGQQIDQTLYNSLTDNERANNIREVNITEELAEKDEDTNQYKQKYYFYCRESYTVGEKGEGVPFTSLTNVDNKTTYAVGEPVPQDIFITEDTYRSLHNLQTGFIIHGTAPIETATFYVAREPDIYDLKKEKIISVIYLYEYQESDESGNNITPVSERHIVNIHINFESGIPEIGSLTPPDIVLPGTTVGLNIPSVAPGAFEITSAGWEIFPSEGDADLHKNGLPYENNNTPMYWYQNNYYVAYYAQTYLGKTYSNAVPVSVANYHDLKKVMEDKQHHYYIDHEDVDRASKIYINDYTVTDASGTETPESQNGLALFRQLFDLSVLNGSSVATDPATGLITQGDLTGHALLKPRVKAGQNLEFILRANQTAPGGATAWTPIGDDTNCFEGNFHGDGYTVSGLDHSLFGRLCGNVYNLGVTGSFTSAGVADSGDGFVENCWIKTTATSRPEGAAAVNPVFGTATDNTQLVNSYYPASNAALYTATAGSGSATRMPDQAFYNGTVAYNLNGYYLAKRYYDHTAPAGSTDGNTAYTYLKPNTADGTLQPLSGSYPSQYVYYPLDKTDKKYGYVEDRYAYPDFIYANGTIPENADARLLADGLSYAPIWPDDYLFFGQMLTYGYNDQRPHEPLPAHNVKSGNGRLPGGDESNRVYRAPAYFRSKVMGVAHYNPWANLAGHSADGLHEAYPNMTAIDFTGCNDVSAPYRQGFVTTLNGSVMELPGAFYPPLLDNDGLTGIANRDLTKNLLIYIPESTADAATAEGMTRTVVNNYNSDPSYWDYDTDNGSGYRRVAENKTAVNAHIVERTEGSGSTPPYQSLYDHYLVDRQDFNAPIAYTFTEDKRMWYQRKPDNYVTTAWTDHDNDEATAPVRTTTGWEGVCLPFEAELVSTHQKGEITHFYSGGLQSRDDSPVSIGHEYWLRSYTGGSVSATDSKVFEATMSYPAALVGSTAKDYTNTFLWDHYYSHNGYDDANRDDYQEDDAHNTYYKEPRTYEGYARLQAATPYIIGFPGRQYYEFDLSGDFLAENAAAPRPAKLDKQVISFVSTPGITIGVSDDETAGITADGYTFKPSYLNWSYTAAATVPTGFAGGTTSAYALSSTGASYDVLPTAAATAGTTIAEAFRPYFAAAPSPSRQTATRSIVFSTSLSNLGGSDKPAAEAAIPGTLTVSASRHRVLVTSTLDAPADVRIVSMTGITVNTFAIQPGETVETRIYTPGVYIVQDADGRYLKKLAVR